jgi:hypothetical protein
VDPVYCVRCKTVLQPTDVFCPKCGADQRRPVQQPPPSAPPPSVPPPPAPSAVPEPCPVCHTPISPNATVCPHCGEPLAAATSIRTSHYTLEDAITDTYIVLVFWTFLYVFHALIPATMVGTVIGAAIGSAARREKRASNTQQKP